MIEKNLINLESLIDLCRKFISAEDEYYVFNSTLLSIIGKLTLARAATVESVSGQIKVITTKGQFNKVFDTDFIEYINKLHFNELSIITLPNLHFIQYALPLLFADKKIIFLFGRKLNGAELSDEEIKYAGLVGQIANIALNNIANKNNLVNEKKQLDEQNFKLVNLLETTKELTTFKSKDEIIKLFSLTIMGQTLITKFMLLYEFGEKIECLIDRLNCYNQQQHVDLFYTDYDFSKDKLFAFNLNFRDKKKGLLLIDIQSDLIQNNKKLFIELLGNIIVSALENDRLIKEEIAKKTIENELNLALEIQKGLLPTTFPKNNEFSIYGKSIPSRYVAGDYFDVITIDDNKIVLVVADISGKGMPASLLMANFQAALRILVRLDLPLKEIVSRLNKLVFENTTADKFVTFFIATFDSQTNRIEYINAGHNRPLLIKDKKIVSELNLGGPILGVFENYDDYKIGTLDVQAEETILFYTDGATDIKNLADVELGLIGFYEMVCMSNSDEAEEIIEILFEKFNDFGNSDNIYDDITVMCLKIKKPVKLS